jgi:hypothetical protein
LFTSPPFHFSFSFFILSLFFVDWQKLAYFFFLRPYFPVGIGKRIVIIDHATRKLLPCGLLSIYLIGRLVCYIIMDSVTCYPTSPDLILQIVHRMQIHLLLQQIKAGGLQDIGYR